MQKIKTNNLCLKFITFFIVLNLVTLASAATMQTSFLVSATVQNSCLTSTFTADPLNFGNYTGNLAQSFNTIHFQCTVGDNLSFAINPGNSGSFPGTRYMVNGSYQLNYNVYTSNSYATIWGDGTGGTSTQTVVATGVPNQTLTAYGQVPAGQTTVPAGAYNDTLTVTVTY